MEKLVPRKGRRHVYPTVVQRLGQTLDAGESRRKAERGGDEKSTRRKQRQRHAPKTQHSRAQASGPGCIPASHDRPSAGTHGPRKLGLTVTVHSRAAVGDVPGTVADRLYDAYIAAALMCVRAGPHNTSNSNASGKPAVSRPILFLAWWERRTR
jgi:hypothetical protein